MQVEVEAIPGSASVLADQTCGISLIDRTLQALCFVVELAPNIDVTAVDAHPRRGQEAPFDKLVRVVPQDIAILASARLALIRIDDEIGRPVALFWHERPFKTGRKAGPSASAQPRFLDLLADPVATLVNQLSSTVPIAAPPGPVQP